MLYNNLNEPSKCKTNKELKQKLCENHISIRDLRSLVAPRVDDCSNFVPKCTSTNLFVTIYYFVESRS